MKICDGPAVGVPHASLKSQQKHSKNLILALKWEFHLHLGNQKTDKDKWK